jgi:hypothetical protein
LFTIQTSFSIIRTVTHNLQRTAILKLPKLALCPLSAITTQPPREGKFLEVIFKGLLSRNNSQITTIPFEDSRNGFLYNS